MKRLVLALALAAVASLAATETVQADHPWNYPGYNRHDRVARYHAAHRPWHAPYAYTPWGAPTALVVPPTAAMHTDYNWGVAQTRMSPTYHQFDRPYPGEFYGGGEAIMGTPHWPSSTTQFGVYPVRGPW